MKGIEEILWESHGVPGVRYPNHTGNMGDSQFPESGEEVFRGGVVIIAQNCLMRVIPHVRCVQIEPSHHPLQQHFAFRRQVLIRKLENAVVMLPST